MERTFISSRGPRRPGPPSPRIGAAWLRLLFLLPSIHASGSSVPDSAGDQRNAFIAGQPLLPCHDDATDVIAFRASSDGVALSLAFDAVDPAGAFTCTGPQPTLVERRWSYLLAEQHPPPPSPTFTSMAW